MQAMRYRHPYCLIFMCAFLTLLGLGVTTSLAATNPVTITAAVYNKKTNNLVVKTKTNGTVSGTIQLLHSEGGILAEETATKNQQFTFPRSQLGQIPCRVEARLGDTSASKAVVGSSSECGKVPTCKITAPIAGTALPAGTNVSFNATAKLTDKKAGPLKYEWDFAGGALGHPTSLTASATFIRDNSHYRVRFSATDSKGRRCDAAVNVTVGNPPSGLPAKVAEQTAAKRGSEVTGANQDIVVLPFEDWTMQSDSDSTFMPSLYNSMSPTIHTIKAVVYEKALKPLVLNQAAVQLSYSAASNPADPVGLGSINSTSQNWPLNSNTTLFSPMMTATVQKSQLWEKNRASWPNGKADNYKAGFYAAFGSTYPFSPLPEAGNPEPDEGYIIGIGQADTLNGSFMPGKNNPYTSNDAQAFGLFNAEEGLHETRLLPLSDVDDKGRINPYPLFRVQAKQGSKTASTDAVMTISRDFQCRGCHAKGKIAANPNAPHTRLAFSATPAGQHQHNPKTPLDKPVFYEAKSDNIYDQEYAAALNYSSIHDFYDGYELLQIMLRGNLDGNGKVTVDGPIQCTGCHNTAMRAIVFDEGWWTGDDFDPSSHDYDPNYTVSMHRFHGELQYNANKTDIVRDSKGMYVRWDWKTKGRNTKTLFPIFDQDGKQLPMEDNCLQCHAGQREQHYRDRMSTAGVTCYDCHGDMLAVGETFPKNYLSNKAKLGSKDLLDYRVGWFDNPDCGSCHVGDGNLGKDKANGFFSAGVKKQAFDDADLSATTRAVDRNNANSSRFTAAPMNNYKASFITYYYSHDGSGDKELETKVDAPVYRFGKDSHGNVPCSACHGAAHAVWPNRDPRANDNITAIQLQGHSGTITACNVCHTADSFKQKDDLDGGTYSGDTKAHILGGPHNMHPVNDPYWWQEAPGDDVDSTPNSPKRRDGVIKGGWHNDYAQYSGKNGEDQCAACHGNDHKGTRLSKTPVDRDFVDEKGVKKSVKAGTAIGCDLCHSLQKSFPIKLTSG